MIINRNYLKEFKTNKVKLVYGRRKTGKSFYVQNFIKYNKFFFIYRDKSIKNTDTNENWQYEELKRYILENKDKIIVVDEFHRLGDDFTDFIHSQRLNNLIIITSSLHVAKKILTNKSPVLGLVYPIEFNLITPCEIITNLKNKNNFIEQAIFYREPTLIELYNDKENFTEFLLKYYKFAKYWSVALFGEIFEDEDKILTETYDAIIRNVSAGNQTIGEITTNLYNQKIITKETPGAISAYIDTLVNIGVLEKIQIYDQKRYKYKIKSAPIDFFFYLNSKYGENVSEKEIIEAWQNKISFYIEDFISELLIEKKGLTKVIYNKPDQEIDVVLKKFKKIEIIGSIKWKKIDAVKLTTVKQNLNINAKTKFLFVKEKKNRQKIEDIIIYDPSDLKKICE